MREKFKEFMEKRKAWEMFKEHFEEESNDPEFYWTDQEPESYIIEAFYWGDAEIPEHAQSEESTYWENDDYWSDLHNKWEDHYWNELA